MKLYAKLLSFILILQIHIFATALLTYNTYDRDNRVDIMLSFDTPYMGKIFLKKSDNNFIITLNNISFDKTITKSINSNIISQIKIVPVDKNVEIYIKSDKNINIIASKTTDGFGLRLRATLKKVQLNTQTRSIPAFKTNLKTDDNNYSNSRYYIVLFILFLLIIMLIFIKKRVSKSPLSNKNWLFSSNIKNEDIKILYRKPIDAKNSVMLISYNNRKYLILTGSSNQLLDKFTNNNSLEESEEEEFEKIFAQNRQKLDEFLRVGNDKLSSYRDKASLDLNTKE